MRLTGKGGKTQYMISKRLRDNMNAYMFLLPTLVLFCAFTVYPFFNAFYVSLCKWDGLTDECCG